MDMLCCFKQLAESPYHLEISIQYRVIMAYVDLGLASLKREAIIACLKAVPGCPSFARAAYYFRKDDSEAVELCARPNASPLFRDAAG